MHIVNHSVEILSLFSSLHLRQNVFVDQQWTLAKKTGHLGSLEQPLHFPLLLQQSLNCS